MKPRNNPILGTVLLSVAFGLSAQARPVPSTESNPFFVENPRDREKLSLSIPKDQARASDEGDGPSDINRYVPSGLTIRFGANDKTNKSRSWVFSSSLREQNKGRKKDDRPRLDIDVASYAMYTTSSGTGSEPTSKQAGLIGTALFSWQQLEAWVGVDLAQQAMELVNSEEDFDGDDGVISNGLEERSAPPTLSKFGVAYVVWENEKGEAQESLIPSAIRVSAGRTQSITPLGVFTRPYDRTQTVAINKNYAGEYAEIAATFFSNTLLRVGASGILAEYSDDRFENVDRSDGFSGYASIASALEANGPLNLYFSVAHNDESFVNINQRLDRQRGENNQFGAGAQYSPDAIFDQKVTFSLEGLYQDNKDTSVDNEYVIVGQIAYTPAKAVTISAGNEYSKSTNDDETGNRVNLTLSYRIFNNLTTFARLEYLAREQGGNNKIATLGIELTPARYDLSTYNFFME